MSSMTSQSGSMDNYSCCSNGNGSGNNSRRRHRRSNPGDATILKANTGFLGPTRITVTAPLLQAIVNQPIASVTIDTDALDDPSILVQFLGTLTTTATTPVGLTFNFTLFRSCRGMAAREQLRSFAVSQVIAAVALNNPDSRGLSFAFNQNDLNCKDEDCCTYTLELTSVNASAPVSLDVVITGTLSVLAVGEEEE